MNNKQIKELVMLALCITGIIIIAMIGITGWLWFIPSMIGLGICALINDEINSKSGD